MPILSRKSIHSERNCSTDNIPFLECRPALQMHAILIIPPLFDTSSFILCGSSFKLLVDQHFELNLTERLKSIFFPQ